MERPFFTIFVPAYNRAHTIVRALDSIPQQSCQDFEVILVDDGSTDNTRDVVNAWNQQHDDIVRYIHKENGGKHTAHNLAVQQARGELFMTLDSDDALAPEALQRARDVWGGIPAHVRDEFAGLEGHCVDLQGNLLGDWYPDAPLDSDYITVRHKLAVTGDKTNFTRTDVLRAFQYPEFEGERHVRPSLLWKRIAHHYKTRYVNEVFRLVEYQPEGLSADRFGLRMRNPRSYRFYSQEDVNEHLPSNAVRKRRQQCAHFVRYSLHAHVGYCQQCREIQDKRLWLRSVIPGTVKWVSDQVRLRCRGHAQ